MCTVTYCVMLTSSVANVAIIKLMRQNEDFGEEGFISQFPLETTFIDKMYNIAHTKPIGYKLTGIGQ